MATSEVTDIQWMRHALSLAERGTGNVSPNPRVGCVIVHDGAVIAEGWHARYGGQHAEAHALAQADRIPADATLYVNLEPCSHHGKTPPCADAIIASGIKRVVVGMTDPYHEVAGRGIERLRAAGIEVVVNVCHDEAQWLNRFFTHHVTTGTPWVIAKIAQSIDGYIANADGTPRSITSPESRVRVHALRAEVDAVLTGIGTVLADDPLLTVRDVVGRSPRRIILDSTLRLPLTSRLVATTATSDVLVFCATDAAQTARADALRHVGVEVIGKECRDGKLDLAAIMHELGTAHGVGSVMVEAGPGLLTSLFALKFVHELRVLTAPLLLGSGLRWHSAPQDVGTEPSTWMLHEIDYVGGDLHQTFLPIRS